MLPINPPAIFSEPGTYPYRIDGIRIEETRFMFNASPAGSAWSVRVKPSSGIAWEIASYWPTVTGALDCAAKWQAMHRTAPCEILDEQHVLHNYTDVYLHYAHLQLMKDRLRARAQAAQTLKSNS